MSVVKLEKNICAKTETYNVMWIKKNFMKMSPKYLKARESVGGGLTVCFGCAKEFKNGEQIILACLEGVGNEVFCEQCTTNMEKGETCYDT